MDAPSHPPEILALRKMIHDINGEIFLIRGNAEVALHQIDKASPLRKNLEEVIARSEALEARVRDLRNHQLEQAGIPTKSKS